MLLAVVTSAGCRRTRGGTNIKQCVYMDDRTFWAATQYEINEQIHKWIKWAAVSRKVGLVENEEKTQRTSVGDGVIKFLGVSTVAQPLTMSPLEQSRINHACNRAALIRKTWLSLDRLIAASQSLVVSKASYGWVARWPVKK
jgi:hypothetical protein